MINFIKKILIFGLIIILLVSFLLFILNKNHKYLATDMYYANEFNSAFKNKNYELLVLGNSKALASIDKKTLERTTGLKSSILAYSSANLSVSKLTLESYLNNYLVKPKIVLLEVSWFSFNNKRTDLHSVSAELFLNDKKLFSNILKYYPKILYNLRSVLKKQILNHIYPKNQNISFKSRFNIEKTPFKKSYSFIKKDMISTFPEYIAGIDKLLLDDFNSILNLCNKNNIQLILFTAPEDEEYSSFQIDQKIIKEIFINASTDNLNIKYLDYSLNGKLWDKKYEYWLRNSHHINENDLFTDELIKNVLED